MFNSKQRSGSLSLKMTYIYSLGDFCFTFFISFIGYYLMFFLTDVIMFESKVAASIYTIVQTFETIGVLLGGFVTDRVKIKGGKFRPWVFIGSTVCGILLVVLFTNFNIPHNIYTYVFMSVYCLCYWGYNFMWVGFRALAGYLSQNKDDVMNLAIASQQAAVVASLIFSRVAVKLLYGFESLNKGFTVSCAIYGAVIIICMYVVGHCCKPYDNDFIEEKREKKESATLKDMIQCISGPMLPFFTSNVLRNSVAVAIPALMVYYFNYVLEDAAGMEIYLSIVSILQIVAAIIVKPINKWFSKIYIYRMTAVLSVVALTTAYFLGSNLYVFVMCMAINNMSMVIASTSVNAFITDVADYNEYKRGLKTRGFTVSLSGTANTLASFIGGAIGSWSLVLIGYDSTLAMQSSGLAQKIRMVVTLGTAVLTLLSIIPFMFYKLDEKMMQEVYDAKTRIIQET